MQNDLSVGNVQIRSDLNDQVSTAHEFVTSDVQQALERRVRHVVAAGLIVSEGATRKLIDMIIYEEQQSHVKKQH